MSLAILSALSKASTTTTIPKLLMFSILRDHLKEIFFQFNTTVIKPTAAWGQDSAYSIHLKVQVYNWVRQQDSIFPRARRWKYTCTM